MILFNLIVWQNISGQSRKLVSEYKRSPVFSKHSSSVTHRLSMAYIVRQSEIPTIPKQDLAKRNFIKKNYLQKILNNTWQQAIFLSIPTKSYDKYAIDLSYLDPGRDKMANKQLIYRFSRALLEGSVTSFASTNSINSPIVVSSVQYMWRTALKLRQENLLNVFRDSKDRSCIKSAKNYLSHSSLADHFPIFTVSNYLGQMIISETPSNLKNGRNMFYRIAPELHGKHLHQAWFFINFEDAQEYMSSISAYYDLQKDHLRILSCNFSTFYSLVDKFSQKLHLRLLPDLKEVSNIVKKYRNYSNVSFHKKQKHSSVYFQGQPLYMLEANNQTRNYYKASGASDLSRYDLLFTDYATACSTLNKTAERSVTANKSQRPSLLVYNLESFIRDEFLEDNHSGSFLLVPSENTYWFTKKHLLEKEEGLVNDIVVNCLSFIELWSKRVLWSLTSKQPT